MALVPIIPTANVPLKPAAPHVVDGVGLQIGYLLGEGQGIPQEINGRFSPTDAPPGGSWVSTPWGQGYHLSGVPFLLGQFQLAPPVTYHALFKPDFPNPAATKSALAFGEVAITTNEAENGVGLQWMDTANSTFAFFVANRQAVFSYTPLQPAEQQWYSVTCTFDGATATFYINGAPTTETGHPQPADASTKYWALGGPNFNGVIADARAYNRILSDSEIATITSGPRMWADYGAAIPKASHQWRRHVWQTQRGPVRVARRVARVGR